MRQWLIPGLCALLLLLAAACGTKHLAAPPSGLDLSGAWQLNNRDSQDAASLRDSVRARVPPGAPGGGGRMPGGGGPMGGGRGGPGMPGGGSGRAVLPLELLRPLERLTIEQRPDAITFRFTPKEGVIVPTNGKQAVTSLWPGIEELRLEASWREDGLELKRSLRDRGSITEILNRAPGSERLVVTTKLPGGRSIRRVYDRVPQ